MSTLGTGLVPEGGELRRGRTWWPNQFQEGDELRRSKGFGTERTGVRLCTRMRRN